MNFAKKKIILLSSIIISFIIILFLTFIFAEYLSRKNSPQKMSQIIDKVHLIDHHGKPFKNSTLKNFSTLIRAFDKIFILEDTITPRIEETNKTDKALIEYSFERELLYCSESFKTKASLLEIAPSAIFFIFAKINWISASVRFSFDEDIFWI